MIYDFTIVTGDKTVSGCHSKDLSTNNFNGFNLEVGGTLDEFHYNPKIVTGQDTIRLSMNGMNYTQEVPSQTVITNKTVFKIETGDFFVKGTGADPIERNVLNFVSTAPHKSNYRGIYSFDTGGIFIGTGDLGASLKTSIVGRYPAFASAADNFVDFEYFLNGQKVYSGLGVGASAANEPDFSTDGGVVTSANKNKFKYTAYKKGVRTHSVTGLSPDLYSDTGFVEGRTSFYINGVLQHPDDYLETYTGVEMIKSGVSASVNSGLRNGLYTDNLSL